MNQKLYIETVGCQMNVLDSELVIGALKRQGYVLTDTAADADVVLFNTCSVREHAEDKTYSALGRVRLVKRDNPDAVIGAAIRFPFSFDDPFASRQTDLFQAGAVAGEVGAGMTVLDDGTGDLILIDAVDTWTGTKPARAFYRLVSPVRFTL